MRATWLIALLAPLATQADAAVSLRSSVAAADALLAGKTPEQIHSKVLVYYQPFRFEKTAALGRTETTKSSSGITISVPLDDAGGSGGKRPVREAERRQSNQDKPAYGGLSDPRAASMDDGSGRSTNPCSGSGYHDNVMAHGLDSARTKCELHALDKNRWQLWGLSGGDPLLRYAMDKQLDKGLDLFGVSKTR